MYAYCECHVIVLPQIDPPSTFPEGPDKWGRVSDTAYSSRGWSSSEYSCARANGRIVNADDPAVCEVRPSPLGR